MAIYLGKESVGGLNGRLNMYLGKQKVLYPGPELFEWKWFKRPNPPNISSIPRGLAISKNGETVAVTTSCSPFFIGYDWDELNNTWIKRPDPQEPLPGVGDPLGNTDIRISDDGKVIAICHYGSGDHISSYDYTESSWVKRSTMNHIYQIQLGSGQSHYIGLSGDGRRLIAHSDRSSQVGLGSYLINGKMKVYEWDGFWSDISLETSGILGDGVGISGDGNVICWNGRKQESGNLSNYFAAGIRQGNNWLNIQLDYLIGIPQISYDGSFIFSGGWFEKTDYTFGKSNVPTPSNLNISPKGLSGSGKTILGSVPGLTRTLGVSDLMNNVWVSRPDVGSYPAAPSNVVNPIFTSTISTIGNTVGVCYPASPYVSVWDWLPVSK
jgi:hypothetical protein